MTHLFGSSENTPTSITQGSNPGPFQNVWEGLRRAESERQSLFEPANSGIPAHNNSSQPNGQTMYAQHMGAAFPQNQATAPNPFTFTSAQRMSYMGQGEAQRVPSGAAPNTFPHLQHRTNPTPDASHAEFPQNTASSRRRPLQSLSTDSALPPNLSPQSVNPHNMRRRVRRSDDAGMQPARPPPRDALQALRYSHYLASIAASASAGSQGAHGPDGVNMERARLAQLYSEHLSNNISNIQDHPELVLSWEQDAEHRRRFHDSTAGTDPPPRSKGLDNQNDGRPEPKETEELMVNLECRACMSQLVDTVVLPCGHAVLCRWCADQHMPSSRADRTRPRGNATCPMCRKPVKQKVSSMPPLSPCPKYPKWVG